LVVVLLVTVPTSAITARRIGSGSAGHAATTDRNSASSNAVAPQLSGE